jgi:hypothetical protein
MSLEKKVGLNVLKGSALITGYNYPLYRLKIRIHSDHNACIFLDQIVRNVFTTYFTTLYASHTNVSCMRKCKFCLLMGCCMFHTEWLK